MTEAPTAGAAGDHSRIVNHGLVPSPGVCAIDPVHTFVGFTAQHLVVGRVRGGFERVAGTATIPEEPTASSSEGGRMVTVARWKDGAIAEEYIWS